MPGCVGGRKRAGALSGRSRRAGEVSTGAAAAGGLGTSLDNGRSLGDLSGMFAAMLTILVVGIAVNDAVFAPMERGLLRRRGLVAAA